MVLSGGSSGRIKISHRTSSNYGGKTSQQGKKLVLFFSFNVFLHRGKNGSVLPKFFPLLFECAEVF
jgi:hypothetical protein